MRAVLSDHVVIGRAKAILLDGVRPPGFRIERGRELSLADIAGAAYLSEFHFARLFKKITGATPHAYLAALRNERARRLLAETDLSIGEIGARVGYTSQSHFTKVFRAASGLTPKAFRAAATKLN